MASCSTWSIIWNICILYQKYNSVIEVPEINKMSADRMSDTIGAKWFYKEYNIMKVEDGAFVFKMLDNDKHYFEMYY